MNSYNNLYMKNEFYIQISVYKFTYTNSYIRNNGRRDEYVGPQIGMNPIALWGLPNLEY